MPWSGGPVFGVPQFRTGIFELHEWLLLRVPKLVVFTGTLANALVQLVHILSLFVSFGDGKRFADPRLNHLATSPGMERETGFEPATLTLAR